MSLFIITLIVFSIGLILTIISGLFMVDTDLLIWKILFIISIVILIASFIAMLIIALLTGTGTTIEGSGTVIPIYTPIPIYIG